MPKQLKTWGFVAFLGALFVAAYFAVGALAGQTGLIGASTWGSSWFPFMTEHSFLVQLLYFVIVGHITITAMSLSFHRQHTHQAVKINILVDSFMQAWLWAFTSMSKLDWVSVHIYHHAHSDQEKDPHSPIQNGFLRALALGVVDYSRAKAHPEVLKIRAKLPENRLEHFFGTHLMTGPTLLTFANMLLFGPAWGATLSVMNFMVSPVFAVGGVNALAHWFGYKNYKTTDNSRNLGFLLPLNWIICGELDHNNHHRYPRSASFSHRWYEFDIGYIYLRAMKAIGLARL